ncbi:MAG: CRISPR-associated protein Cas4 [Thaumarchaeota archaeon]|nr:CRISPR-associated protein Cas4 [Candidatus Calditenuaceae archaeon]
MSEDEHPLIPVSLIRQFYYCPRIVYFSQVLGLREMTTELMKAGKEEHAKEEDRDSRRKRVQLGGERYHRLHLRSERLGLEGVVDMVIENKGLVVVERKYAERPRRPLKGHYYQVVAYAMLVESECGRPVRKGRIVYLKSRASIEFEITDEMRRHVLWAVKRIKEIVEEEVIPPYSPRPGCRTCGYRSVCLYV